MPCNMNFDPGSGSGHTGLLHTEAVLLVNKPVCPPGRRRQLKKAFSELGLFKTQAIFKNLQRDLDS